MWPNKDGSVTVSQRKTSSHSQPRVDPAPQRIAQTYLGISAVSNCISYMSKNMPLPFDAWRFSASLITTLGVLLPDDDPHLTDGISHTVYLPLSRQKYAVVSSCSKFMWSGTEKHTLIGFPSSHSKIKRKHTWPLRCLQMANSSTTLSGPSPPPDPPQKTPALLLPNTSTKARSPSTLQSSTSRPTRLVTSRLRRPAAPVQYIVHRVPRTPRGGQTCPSFNYHRFFRINDYSWSMQFSAPLGSSSFYRSGRWLHGGCARSIVTGSRHIGLSKYYWGDL